MQKKALKKIPAFKNYEEEARFWDTHSFADYWNEFTDIDLKVELHKPRNETLVVRIQKSLKDKLRAIARSKGIDVSTLARILLTEKLQTAH